MANAIYPKWKEAIMQASSNSALTGNIKAILVDSADYTYSASHQFLSDVAGAGIVATSGNLANKTYTDGVFDADDVSFTGVSGDSIEIVILYIDTGTGSTSRLICYLDTGITGAPFTPSGGNVTIQWDSGANKIFAL